MKRIKPIITADRKRIVNLLFIVPVILSLFGIIIVRSAAQTLPDGGIRLVMVQIIGFAAGALIAVFISRIDFSNVRHFGQYIFIVSFGLLLLVLFIGYGADELGSKSWIRLGFVSFQPAETVKIAFIIICAIFLERIKQRRNVAVNYFKLCIYAGILILLVMLQKDYGMAAVFILIFLTMIFIAGVSTKVVLGSIASLLIGIPLLWTFFLNDARKSRILVFLNPEIDPLDAGYNVIQSKLAIGSGRLSGQGLFSGHLNSRALVPVKESDFIFAVIGEELGFLGTCFIVVLFALFLLKILKMAKESNVVFNSLVSYGIFAMFAFHFIQNVSMSIGLLPVTGIPLPFVSAGGTALISYFIAIGILCAVEGDKNIQ